MTVLTFPQEIIPNSMNINLVSNSKLFSSPFNNSVQTHAFTGSHWIMTLNFNSLDNINVRELDILQTFIWSLDGVNGRFTMPIFGRRGGPSRGTPTVEGNSQEGGLLLTKGWTPNSLVLPKASYFQIGDEIKQVKEDVVSNSAGFATLTFHPWLRKSPTTGDAIITDRPQGIFRLTDNAQGDFSIVSSMQAEVSISVTEAFNV